MDGITSVPLLAGRALPSRAKGRLYSAWVCNMLYGGAVGPHRIKGGGDEISKNKKGGI